MKISILIKEKIDIFIEFVEDNKKFTGFVFLSILSLLWLFSNDYGYESLISLLVSLGAAYSHMPKHWFILTKKKIESMKNFKFDYVDNNSNIVKDRGTYKFNHQMKPLKMVEKEFYYHNKKIKIRLVLVSDFSDVINGNSGYATYNLYDFSTGEPYLFHSFTDCSTPEICIQTIDKYGNFLIIVGFYAGPHTQILNVFNYTNNKLYLVNNGVIGSDFSNIVWGVKKDGYFYVDAYYKNWSNDRESYTTGLNSYKFIDDTFILNKEKHIKIK